MRPSPFSEQARAGGVFSVALLASTAFLVVQARRLWFFGDDWDFLLRRGVTGSPRQGIWEPHNEHWSTLPILAYRALYSLFGVRHYLPYATLVLALHAAVTAAVWLLLRRAGIRPWIAASFGAVLALMAAGAENTLWDFQIGFVGSVLFGLVSLLAQPRGRRLRRGDAVTCGALVASLMCSGQGLTMLVVVVVYAFLARGWVAAAVPAAAGLGTYGTWYLAVGHEGMGAPLDSPLGVPAYVWAGLGHVWEGMTGVPGMGVLVLVLAVGWIVRAEHHLDRHAGALAVAGLGGALCLYTLVALTRSHFGLGMATTGRYAYTASVLTTPALALAVQGLIREPVRQLRAQALIVAGLVLVVLNGVSTLVEWREWRTGLIADDPQRVVGTWQLVQADPAPHLLRQLPGSDYDTQLDVEGVVAAGREGKLPDLGENRRGVLQAAAALQVSVAPNGLGLPAPESVRGTHGVLLEATSLLRGCIAGRSTRNNGIIELPVGPAGAAVAIASGGKQLGTQLADGGLFSAVETWPTTPGTRYSAGSTAAGKVLRLVLPRPTTFTLCP